MKYQIVASSFTVWQTFLTNNVNFIASNRFFRTFLELLIFLKNELIKINRILKLICLEFIALQFLSERIYK